MGASHHISGLTPCHATVGDQFDFGDPSLMDADLPSGFFDPTDNVHQTTIQHRAQMLHISKLDSQLAKIQ